jgi:ankyrin repeat protein
MNPNLDSSPARAKDHRDDYSLWPMVLGLAGVALALALAGLYAARVSLFTSAIRTNYLPAAKVLLSFDRRLANEPVYQKGGVPLAIAIKRQDYALIDLLLKSGADVNAENGAPLASAIALGHMSFVKHLLDKGAIAQKDHFLGAADYGSVPIMELLLKKHPELASEADAALPLAAADGQAVMTEFLLDLGAPLDGQDNRGGPLIAAILRNHVYIAKLLLEKGANLHAQQERPLRAAVEAGNVKMTEWLLDRGADLHIDNDAPLREAAPRSASDYYDHRPGHDEVVRLLIRRGANLDALEPQWRAHVESLMAPEKTSENSDQAALPVAQP